MATKTSGLTKTSQKSFYSQRQNAGGSVTVWGAISAKETNGSSNHERRHNGNRYIEMCDNSCLFQERHRLCQKNSFSSKMVPQFHCKELHGIF